MTTPRRTVKAVLAVAAVCASLGLASAPGHAAGVPDPLRGAALQQAHRHQAVADRSARSSASPSSEDEDEGDALEVADRAEQYSNERSAPAETAPAAALVAARRHIASMPTSTATPTEVTTKPYQAEPVGYTDPAWSNAGSGFGIVSGRVTALASDGSRLLYAGAADGGVWRSRDGGAHWVSVWDHQDTLSIGALTVDASHALWVGTGEANTNSDSYQGLGIYRSTDQGASFTRVGGSELVDSQVYRIAASGNGWMYAATSQGLYRHRSDRTSGAWQLVLKPDPNPTGSPYFTSIITDVAIRPGTSGQDVTAVLGWRNGSDYNGFYHSSTGGGPGSFSRLALTGAIDTSDIGRTTLAYAGDGSRLYAIVESPAKLLAGAATNLQGVFVSRSGSPRGPWTRIATSHSLGSSGSALRDMDGYHVGIQSWYNQALLVDPRNPDKVYVSLEEVFQTDNGGRTFTTASPYWNYGLACGSSCPRTTHPDQHALTWLGGDVVIGNDGGVYKRPTSATGYGRWTDLNAGLHTLQYYGARDGVAYPTSSSLAYWGGLQDNGTSFLLPNRSHNIEPAGGDGGMVLVDPSNAQRAVGEYTDLDLYRTSDGGHSFTTISPVCGNYTGADCDPSARFIAPFVADVHDVNHWVAGGSKIWDTRKGWSTTCAGTTCDWTVAHSLGLDASGAPNLATALAVSGATTYAAWVGGGGNPGPAFASGIDTNYGGAWHRIASPVLPNRYIAGLTVDPANPAHVYAIFNGYSRRWIPGGGLGVVFASTDGGSTWRNISGNLPDAPGDALAVVSGQLVLGTDVGVFTASMQRPTVWSHVAGLPNVSVNDMAPSARGSAVVAGTHGRGIWRITVR